MKYYRVQNYSEETGAIQEVLSEQDILNQYWAWWALRMAKKFGPYHPSITHQGCIDYFVMVHYAWETKIDE